VLREPPRGGRKGKGNGEEEGGEGRGEGRKGRRGTGRQGKGRRMEVRTGPPIGYTAGLECRNYIDKRAV